MIFNLIVQISKDIYKFFESLDMNPWSEL